MTHPVIVIARPRPGTGVPTTDILLAAGASQYGRLAGDVSRPLAGQLRRFSQRGRCACPAEVQLTLATTDLAIPDL